MSTARSHSQSRSLQRSARACIASIAWRSHLYQSFSTSGGNDTELDPPTRRAPHSVSSKKHPVNREPQRESERVQRPCECAKHGRRDVVSTRGAFTTITFSTVGTSLKAK
jgi:hypothetical protein